MSAPRCVVCGAAGTKYTTDPKIAACDEHANGDARPLLPAPLPSHRFLASLTVLGEEGVYCIAPDPEERDEPTRGLRVWRWLPWAEEIRHLARWREQGGERAHRVMCAWAEKAVEEEREGCAAAVEALGPEDPPRYVVAAAIRARGSR